MGQSDNQPDNRPHTPGDDRPDDQADARWMTFAELAASRGISKESAIALVRRKRWRRQRDNKGHVIALVPNDGPELRRSIPDEVDHRPDDRGDYLPHMAAFETALAAIEAAHASEIAALRERADTSEQGRIAMQTLADRLGAQLADAGERIDRAERARDRAEARAEQERLAADRFRAEAETARTAAEQANARAQEAQEAADALRRTEEARKALGRLARFRAAWRGT
jgi:hypothetical protein